MKNGYNGNAEFQVNRDLADASIAWMHAHRYVWCAWCGASGQIKATLDGTSIKCCHCQTISPSEL